MTFESTVQSSHDGNLAQSLSWFQERLWLINQKQPRDLSYNIPVGFLIEGPLDVGALERSLCAIINRHQSLRTRFVPTTAGGPRPVVSPPVDSGIPTVVVAEQEVPGLVREFKQHVFDLSNGPVIISKLLRITAEKHVLLLNVHHIVADGWSIEGVLFSELLECYRAYCSGKSPELVPLPIQYADFARWQRNVDMSSDLTYWLESLANYEDSLELPTDFVRQPNMEWSSGTLVRTYAPEFSRSLEQFARAHGCTLFMGLLAGFALVVNRYTGRDDLCVGTTTSGRTLPGSEDLIGFFINVLPLRLRVDEDVSVREYMRAVREVTLSAFEHQIVPFERILYSLGHDRSANSTALVPLVLRHQNFPRTRMDSDLLGGARFEPLAEVADESPESSRGVAARCEIELSFTGDRDDLKVEVMYASDLYRRETIERLLSQHEQILRAMIENDQRPVAELPLLEPAEAQRMCRELNQTRTCALPTENFVERFDLQAKRSPKAIACRDNSGSLSFEQLASQANRLAGVLRGAGIEMGDVVGICLERGAPLLVSILSIWKAGAAYLPLDPSYPDAYLRQILEDASPARVICTTATKGLLGLPESRCMALDALTPTLESASESSSNVSLSPDALAYVMYTSGSTGKPKGVRVPHRQLINWLEGIETSWPFQPGEVVAQKTTMAFAVSVKELFAGLLNGCEQVFLETRTVQDAPAFANALSRFRVSRLNLVPSHLEALLSHLKSGGFNLPDLRLCIVAGEPLNADLVMSFRTALPKARLVNNYGCTELNDITYYDATAFSGDQGFVPIGKPIQNSKLYVLDRRKRLVPVGVAGELHVASVGMADGYQNLDELTRERFLPNPFADEPGSIIYNTGDVVRYLPDGNLEFIGRWDFQVKVRGFRVDVRHVEKVLGDFPGIGQRAVTGEGNQLLAFYVPRPDLPPDQTLDVGEVRAFLQARLPPYMVPTQFVALASMPRLPNGKLDRRALKPSVGQIQQSDAFDAPRSSIEKTLAAVWSEVLEIPEDDIGRQTHFFEVGGHSLAATRVLARIKEKFRIEVALSQLFERPHLAELSSHLSEVLLEHQGDDASLGSWQPTSAASHNARIRPPGLLEAKVALVTGAGRAIGSAIARLLAQHGAKVAINYSEDGTRAIRAKEMIEQEGGVAELFQADVTDPEQVRQLVTKVRTKFGGIDVLVANSAVDFKLQPFIQCDWSEFERKLSSELKSVFLLSQAVVPGMIERKSGSIVAISNSMSRVYTRAGFVAHSTAMAAVDSFVRALASELGPEGIRVNTVAPGATLTEVPTDLPPQRRDATAAQSPLRRNGLPRDVAGAVLFLASDLSHFMTGGYLPVDGGFTML